MPAATITTATVLQAVQNGSDTIWALASAFRVAAASRELGAALDMLLDDGTVVASDSNIFVARLKATTTD
jgi:hypothetical protein